MLIIIIIFVVFINQSKLYTNKLVIAEYPQITYISHLEYATHIENGYTEEDLYWLSKIVMAETFYDTDEGQQAVANVVLNRVSSSGFPDSIYEVVWQKTGETWQFSPCGDGGIHREPDERAIENAKVILRGERVLPEDILFFYMPTKSNKSNWIRSRKVYKKIGVHNFCY